MRFLPLHLTITFGYRDRFTKTITIKFLHGIRGMKLYVHDFWGGSFIRLLRSPIVVTTPFSSSLIYGLIQFALISHLSLKREVTITEKQKNKRSLKEKENNYKVSCCG